MLKAVLVDDEPSARKLLRLTLQTTGAVTVVGEAGSVAEAVTVLQNAQPDVVFLDVQLREETGFDLLDIGGKEFDARRIRIRRTCHSRQNCYCCAGRAKERCG